MTSIDVRTEAEHTSEHIVDGSAVAVTATELTALAETANRPAWLPNGCPPWCEVGAQHKDRDRFADRRHFGSSSHITLTAEEPPLGPGVAADGKGWTGKSVRYDEPAEAGLTSGFLPRARAGPDQTHRV
jgi:hypothetical protein